MDCGLIVKPLIAGTDTVWTAQNQHIIRMIAKLIRPESSVEVHHAIIWFQNFPERPDSTIYMLIIGQQIQAWIRKLGRNQAQGLIGSGEELEFDMIGNWLGFIHLLCKMK